ncbi:MAG: response regulator transcription factor [Actinomycetota bacterium]|nr:response regulator transcription factor [Actinomycetota bacterium]
MMRILLADDQAMVRTGLRMILDAQPDLAVVGEASDGRQAVHEAHRLRPDAVLMDIRMPGMDGVEATRRLAGPGVEDPLRVIVLTTFDLDEYVVEALRAGAAGFLLKDAPAEVLLDGIRAVCRGDALLAPPVTRRLIDRFVASYARPDPQVEADLATLTDREREVLVLVARGLSNDEIARQLYLSDSTVKTHVSNVLAKLHLRDRVQVVVLAYEAGIVRPGST